MNIETVREFMGWCAIINTGIIMITSAIVIWCPGFMTDFHGKRFGIGAADLRNFYFQYLANFKIAIIVLNITPYLALRIMG